MKTILNILLVMVIALGLCACNPKVPESKPSSSTEPSTVQKETELISDEFYGFVYKGVELVPGKEFSAAKLPGTQYSYTEPKDEQGGSVTVYNYIDVEVFVYDDGETAKIQKVRIMNPDLKTPEGIHLGGRLQKVNTLYGEEYTVNGAQWLFTKGNTVLAILTQDNFVASIEYSLKG